MSTVKEIESAITRLSLEEQRAVREWLDDLIEDQLELSDEVQAKLDQARQDISDGRYLTREPDAVRWQSPAEAR